MVVVVLLADHPAVFHRDDSRQLRRERDTAALTAQRQVREQHQPVPHVDEFHRLNAQISTPDVGSSRHPLADAHPTAIARPGKVCLHQLTRRVDSQSGARPTRTTSRSRRLKASVASRAARHSAAWRRREPDGSLRIRRKYAANSRGKRSASRSSSVRLDRSRTRSGLRTTSTFSCDIGYSRSPTARWASSSSR
jgi:hypothetical protein